MDEYLACEAAYKNGYEQGKKDAVVHGRWEMRKAIIFDDELIGYRCSECKTTWDTEMNYCPYCGARMDGGADNNVLEVQNP